LVSFPERAQAKEKEEKQPNSLMENIYFSVYFSSFLPFFLSLYHNYFIGSTFCSAYCEQSRDTLRGSEAVPLLVDVLKSRNPSLFYFDAAIALANIQPTHPDIDGILDVMTLMVTALERTVEGKDFPPNSGEPELQSIFDN
jgi:hypothetical protein